MRTRATIGVLMLFAAGCTRTEDEVVLRDPANVAVGSEGRVLAAPNMPVDTSVPSIASGYSGVSLRRNPAGALFLGERTVIDEHGQFSLTQDPAYRVASPLIRDGTLYFAYPHIEQHGKSRTMTARVSLATPMSNVVRAHEVERPIFSGGWGFFAGGFLLGMGTIFFFAFQHDDKGAAAFAGGACAVSAIPWLAFDTYGLLAKTKDRVIYEAPSEP